MKRRNVLKNMSLAAGAIALNKKVLGASTSPALFADSQIKHSVCRWCYNGIELDALCEAAQEIGIRSIEIVGPKDWPTLKKYNLECALATDSFASIPNGFNEPKYHHDLQMNYKGLITAAADNGVPNVIVFSGNRNGMDDMVGLENCAVGLEPLVKHAEDTGVMIVMELLNSKVNHKDYMCDHTPWGVELVEKIGSPNFKLLYDIYHMQIMEGDVIATIRSANEHIAHYHTGGVPGRHEIDDSQELYYPAIIKAIKETGFDGYLAQEFIPAREDKIASLKQGVEICTV
ncbi:MAG: TIM barrel protein [Saprospiraceae bacterium]|nr:TIM barrel protein [Saprospiraceae bacterium]